MVDCVYYEEMNIDKEAVKKEFNARFGEEFDFHYGMGKKFILTAEDIINITPLVYREVLLGLYHKDITASNNCPDHFYKRYYSSLSLLALINEANPASIIEELEGHPLVLEARALINKMRTQKM